MSIGFFRSWEPLWKGRGGVGIMDDKLARHKFMDVQFMWKRTDGTLEYPGLYRFECIKAIKLPVIRIPNGRYVRDISFADMLVAVEILPKGWNPKDEGIYEAYYFLTRPRKCSR